MKTAAKFTRESPCTKVEIHNAFFNGRDYARRPVVEAKAIIGDNAPKFMLSKGYIEQVLADGVDWYVPTLSGKAWIRSGLSRYLELHPDRAADVIGKAPPKAQIRRRTRAK